MKFEEYLKNNPVVIPKSVEDIYSVLEVMQTLLSFKQYLEKNKLDCEIFNQPEQEVSPYSKDAEKLLKEWKNKMNEPDREWKPFKQQIPLEPDLNYEEQSLYDTRVKYFTDIEDVQMFVSEFAFYQNRFSLDSFLYQSLKTHGAQQLDRIIKTMIRNKKESLMIVNHENEEYDDNLIDLIYQTVLDYIKPYLI
jgi:hypothetical protein